VSTAGSGYSHILNGSFSEPKRRRSRYHAHGLTDELHDQAHGENTGDGGFELQDDAEEKRQRSEY